MIEEAAGALVPGPIVTTALATLVVDATTVVDGARVLSSLMSGERTAGAALTAELTLVDGRVSGVSDQVLGAVPGSVLLLPAADRVVLVDSGAAGVSVEPLAATDFFAAACAGHAGIGSGRDAFDLGELIPRPRGDTDGPPRRSASLAGVWRRRPIRQGT